MPANYLVTGANRGLGLEFVRLLRSRGERVFAACRAPREAADLRSLTPDVLALDVASQASIDSLAAALKGQPVDVLVNNAGVIGNDAAMPELSMAEFQRVFTTNTFGPTLLAKALAPNVRAGSRKLIVNISSSLGSIAQNMHGFSWSYKASKAALNMLTTGLSAALAPDGVTVVTVCPGWNKTDMGGPEAPLDPAESIRSLVGVMDRLTIKDSGTFLSHEGKPIPW